VTKKIDPLKKEEGMMPTSGPAFPDDLACGTGMFSGSDFRVFISAIC
jgi:hypothetical protein